MAFRDDMKAVSADVINVFGETVTFTGAFGPYTVKQVFTPEEQSIDPYTGDMVSTQPQCDAISADVENAKHKDQVRIGYVTYEVVEVRPDGYGVTTLFLNKIRTD